MRHFFKLEARNLREKQKKFLARCHAIEANAFVKSKRYDCGTDNILTFEVRIFQTYASGDINIELDASFAKEHDPFFFEKLTNTLKEMQLAPYLGNALVSANGIYSYTISRDNLEKIQSHHLSESFSSKLNDISENPFIDLYESLISFTPQPIQVEQSAPRKSR